MVPTNISDNTLDYMASLHRGNRLPTWCWSHPDTGVTLTRGAAPSIDDTSEAPDPKYIYRQTPRDNVLTLLSSLSLSCSLSSSSVLSPSHLPPSLLHFLSPSLPLTLPSSFPPSLPPPSSYMYAVSMARNIDHQVENKRTATLDVTRSCGTIWDLRTAFSHMQDFCLPGNH